MTLSRRIPCILLSAFLFCIVGCSSYNSIDRFYEEHKNDSQVTAILVPQVMINLLAGISPEMQGIIGNTKDIRYMKFNGLTTSGSRSLNNRMNSLTSSSFIEVYRKNDDLKRNVITIREKKNTVKEILVYNNNNINASFLYFNGDFNPAEVRKLAQSEEFREISEGIFNQFGNKTISE